MSGQPPFVADHVAAVLVRILFENPIPLEQSRPGAPAAICSLVDRLLAKDPAQRLSDAAALKRELAFLGEAPEPALAVTMASANLPDTSFAENEQSLFSVVLAELPESEPGLDATLRPIELLQSSERQSLLDALQPLCSSADFLANGALIVTVPSTGSATDQAARAARGALLIKERWPAAIVSMATGRGAVRGRTAVGEVVEQAARSLRRASQPGGPKLTTGIVVDALSAKLLQGRFAQTPQASGALLLGEDRDIDASRPLLGKPTPCVGREAGAGDAGHRRAAEFLERAGEHEAATIADHFERSGEKARAASYYGRAAEDGLARGNFLGALRQVDRGLACAPDGPLLGQLRSRECYMLMLLDRHARLGETAGVALAQLRAGSLGWCRALGPAFFDAINRLDAARVQALVSMVLPTEPDSDARATYIDSLAMVFIISSVVAPEPVLKIILHRLDTVVTQAESENPTIRRYLCICRAWMAHNREPRPWTLAKESQQALELSDQAGDQLWADFARASTMESGWLDLGDGEGVRQRLLALADKMAQCQHMNTVNLWRHLLARALCLTAEQDAWNQAEALVAPMVSVDKGFSLYPILGQCVRARLSLLRGRPQEAEAQARAAMLFFPMYPVWLAHVAPVQIHALLDLGRASEAAALAEQVLSALPALGGYGVAEVEFRLAASEAFHAAGDLVRAHAELRDTLYQVQLRANDITDPSWKQSYLTQNPYCVRAQKLGEQWHIDVIIT